MIKKTLKNQEETQKRRPGRPKGALNKVPSIRSNVRAKRIIDRVQITPLDVLAETMLELWDEGRAIMDVKLQACAIAEKLAPYLHPRLQAIQATIEHDISKLDDAALDAEIRKLLAEAPTFAGDQGEAATLQ